MMKKTLKPKQTLQSSHRRGTAQIELALFLPTYAAAILILLTIFSYARTRGHVAVESRHKAWMQREKFGSQTDSLDATAAGAARVGQILTGQQDPSGGVVKSNRSADATVFLKTLSLITSIRLKHFVLTDPWDHRVLEFEPKGSHPRLVLGRRTTAFGSLDRSKMRDLAGVAGGSAAESAALSERFRNMQNETRRKIARAKERVEREIEARREELQLREDELRRAEAMEMPDEDLIQALRSRMNELNREIEERNQKIADLNEASRLAG